MTTKKIATLGMLTALYVVMSTFLKFTLFSNVMVDLGYVAFAFALCLFGPWGTIVGVLGCALESILFTAYGFSISWAAANLVIGLICGFTFGKVKTFWVKAAITIIAVAIGMLVIKTAIECPLYGIPLAVKLPKNAVAFGADAVTMILGLLFYEATKKRIGKIYTE